MWPEWGGAGRVCLVRVKLTRLCTGAGAGGPKDESGGGGGGDGNRNRDGSGMPVGDGAGGSLVATGLACVCLLLALSLYAGMADLDETLASPHVPTAQPQPPPSPPTEPGRDPDDHTQANSGNEPGSQSEGRRAKEQPRGPATRQETAQNIEPSQHPAKPGAKPAPKPGVDAAAACAKMQKLANSEFRAGNFQPAVEALIRCTAIAPEDAPAHWNVGVLLARLKDYDNALSWMREAIRLNCSSISYYRGAGTTAKRAGRPSEAAALLASALEIMLHLDTGSWNTTLTTIMHDAPEDLIWVEDEDSNAVPVIESIAQMYLLARMRHHAHAALTLCSKLQPKNRGVRSALVNLLFAMGQVAKGMAAAVEDLMVDITETLPASVDSYTAANRDALLLLGAGLPAHGVNIARSLLVADVATTDPDLVRSLAKSCSLTAATEALSPTVTYRLIRQTLAQCMQAQHVVKMLAAKGASGDAENGFGYRVLHHAALFGDVSFVEAVLDLKPDLRAATTLGHTALHVAVMSGSLAVIPLLTSAGVPTDVKDRVGRTAMDVACAHGWVVEEVARLLGTGTGLHTAACEKAWQSAPRTTLTAWPTAAEVGGGWGSAPRGHTQQQSQQTCGIDVRADMTADEFLFSYLAIQRPVLVRGGLVGPQWDTIRGQWSRPGFAARFVHEEFTKSTIPYASAFGLEGNKTTVAQHLLYMDWLRAHASKADEAPSYVFESLSPDSNVARNIQLPPFLDPARTEIQVLNTQFYLGAAGSGAPWHYHRAAFNVLVYGRKRWLLAPPPFAKYSTVESHTNFVAQKKRAPDDKKQVIACTQESGDVLFIPENWGHTTLNLAESVGWASEFLFGASEFSSRK